MGDGQELRLRGHMAHVRVVSNGHFSALLRSHHHRVRRRVKRQHIGLLVHQTHGGFAFTHGIKPGVEPNQFHLGFRVDVTHAQGKGVDALHHFRNGKTRHITGHTGLAEPPSGNACQESAFVITGVGGCHIGRCFVARDGFEFHAGELGRHFHRGLHVAKAGREDQTHALLGHVANHAFGVRAFGHVFHKLGLHFEALLLELRFQAEAAQFMLVHPAAGQSWCDIHKANLQGLLA